jgi:DNA-binding CsgD family transcriptional regulator
MDGIFQNDDLAKLADSDIVDIFNIIQSVHSHSGLTQMRREVVSIIKNAFKAQGVVFFLGDRELGKIDNRNLVAANADYRYRERWAQYYCHYDPFQGEAHTGKAVCKVDDILPYRKWVNLKIYNEFYKPQNIHYKLSMSLTRQQESIGLIGMFRPRDQEDFSKREIAKANILVPYLTTAIVNLIERERNCEGRAPSQDWDRGTRPMAIIILDSDLRLVDWNSEAQELCRASVRTEKHAGSENPRDGVISPEIISDCQLLRSHLAEPDTERPVRFQRIIEAYGRRFQAVSSLEQPSSGDSSSVRFFIYLTDISDDIVRNENFLKERYHLTRRETDIALCVCQGLTNDEIGEKLFISRYTVETHLKSIFAKTKVKHRSGLSGLLRSF